MIHIGRSTDNDVVLYSAVVSRRHVELRKVNRNWEIVSLGANGTFLNGKQIQQTPVSDRIVLRLARSGPQIQIRLGILTLEEIRQSISEHYSQAASTES